MIRYELIHEEVHKVASRLNSHNMTLSQAVENWLDKETGSVEARKKLRERERERERYIYIYI